MDDVARQQHRIGRLEISGRAAQHLAQRVEGAHAAHLPAGITHKVRVGELQQADDGHGTYANATAVPPGQYR